MAGARRRRRATVRAQGHLCAGPRVRRAETCGVMSAIIITTGFDANDKVSDQPGNNNLEGCPFCRARRRRSARPTAGPPMFPAVPPPRSTPDPTSNSFLSIAARDQGAHRQAWRDLRRSGLHRDEPVRLLRHEDHQLAEIRSRGEAVQARGHLCMAS